MSINPNAPKGNSLFSDDEKFQKLKDSLFTLSEQNLKLQSQISREQQDEACASNLKDAKDKLKVMFPNIGKEYVLYVENSRSVPPAEFAALLILGLGISPSVIRQILNLMDKPENWHKRIPLVISSNKTSTYNRLNDVLFLSRDTPLRFGIYLQSTKSFR